MKQSLAATNIAIFFLPLDRLYKEVMENLKDLITNKQRQNIEGRWFMPHQALHDLMTEEVVEGAIRDTKIECYHINDLTRVVLNGAQKIFAILALISKPECILRFVEDDNLQHSHLDHKLPLPLEKLQKLLPSWNAARMFHEEQWKFTAPVFTGSVLPRVLEREVILPYVGSDIEVGDGGFGDVHVVEVEPSHQIFWQGSQQKLVRKEFRPTSTSEADYEIELRNLSILKLLKHPNVIESLGFYTYRDRHNLLFPLARGGTLANLLAGNRPAQFQSDENLIVSLVGLSSALCVVHEFNADDLKAIGCHHDLKPSNILIDGPRFILADFGLSRFKETSQTSATTFKLGRGDFIAPECEGLGDDSGRNIIHRSSDVWSFGCITLELLTYMLKGVDGVKDFRKKRAFTVGNTTFYRFHCGLGNQNKDVMEWMADIEKSCYRAARLVVHLAKQMLSVTPEDRPKMKEVETKLRFIAIDVIAQPINEMYEAICYKCQSIQASIERARFESWVRVTTRPDVADTYSGQASFLSGVSYSKFETILTHLHELRDSLEAIGDECQNTRNRLFAPLQRLNDILLDTLPRELQELASAQVEFDILGTQSLDVLSNRTETPALESPIHRIGALAVLRRMNELVTKRSTTNHSTLQIDPPILCKKLGDFYVGEIAAPRSQERRKVLVECRSYGVHCSDDKIASELLTRLEALAELLNSAEQRKDLHVLHCSGFYHDPTNYVYGLVYDFPQPSVKGEDELCVTTLRTLIESDTHARRLPVLGDRFQLAHNLAASVLEFHKVAWLQKGISSFNIVIFHPEKELNTPVNRVYFLGFLNSRQNDEFAFTEGPGEDSKHKNFQHPDYLHGRLRFKPEFDYYSLGIVLLELGMWRTLSVMTEDWQESAREFREKLLKKRVPRLGSSMGTIYQDVVRVCLSGDFRADVCGVEVYGSNNLFLGFKRLIIDRLAVCAANV